MIQESLILPIQQPQLFTKERKPFSRILFLGPPGTGKTEIARAIASEIKGTFFNPSVSDLISKFQGESSRLIKALFEKARELVPSVIFFDEIDSLGSMRSDNENESTRQIKTELLLQIDGLGRENKKVFVLASTNVPWALDSAILRRFEKRIYIGLPDENARNHLIRLCIGSMEHDLTDEQIKECSEQTDGFSGSDIKAFVTDVLFEPLREFNRATHFKLKKDMWIVCNKEDENAVEKKMKDIPHGTMQASNLNWIHVQKALSNKKKSIQTVDLKRFEQWTQEFAIIG